MISSFIFASHSSLELKIVARRRVWSYLGIFDSQQSKIPKEDSKRRRKCRSNNVHFLFCFTLEFGIEDVLRRSSAISSRSDNLRFRTRSDRRLSLRDKAVRLFRNRRFRTRRELECEAKAFLCS
uniref:Uncharacterized protein n=1 Tax=Pediastrum angulosum TaxID=271408 RepID=A0A2U8GHJ6_9CHLO|nr:hypothetical protein [Pediastrum angulosum]AWI68167.1 hypothetical protein [Pediastrum angulosum]